MCIRDRNKALRLIAAALKAQQKKIIEANARDLERYRGSPGYSEALYDRLLLNEERITAAADGLIEIAALEDPIGEVTGMKLRPNGLQVGQMRVPPVSYTHLTYMGYSLVTKDLKHVLQDDGTYKQKANLDIEIVLDMFNTCLLYTSRCV